MSLIIALIRSFSLVIVATSPARALWNAASGKGSKSNVKLRPVLAKTFPELSKTTTSVRFLMVACAVITFINFLGLIFNTDASLFRSLAIANASPRMFCRCSSRYDSATTCEASTAVPILSLNHDRIPKSKSKTEKTATTIVGITATKLNNITNLVCSWVPATPCLLRDHKRTNRCATNTPITSINVRLRYRNAITRLGSGPATPALANTV